MPGSSLWLVPPEDSELYKAIHDLILNKIPAIYPNASPVRFTPHVTLTSNVTKADLDNPQAWLDSIALPDFLSPTHLYLRHIQIEAPFFRKLTLACDNTRALSDLVAHCRVAGMEDIDYEEAKTWATDEYQPHCSLMYSNITPNEVEREIEKVHWAIVGAKEGLPDGYAVGGSIWLVPTFKEINDWKPIAERRLPDNVGWSWG